MPKTRTEKIENIQTRITQLENERKRLIQQQKEQERKDRTRRLIERGSILESLLDNAEAMSNEDIKELLQRALSPPVTAQNQPEPSKVISLNPLV